MELDIYTDCGGSIDIYGIGIHIIDELENETSFLLKTSIKDINDKYKLKANGTTTIGETHAILTSLSLVNDNVTKVRVYTDSLHSFELLNGIKQSRKNSYLNPFFEIIKDFKSKFEIEVMWIKGHIGIYGNEIADSITKKALKKSIIPNKVSKVEIPKKGESIKFI